MIIVFPRERNCQGNEKTSHGPGKTNFQRTYLIQGLFTEINKEFLKLNDKKVNNPIKNGSTTLTSPEDTQIWQIGFLKGAQHHV